MIDLESGFKGAMQLELKIMDLFRKLFLAVGGFDGDFSTKSLLLAPSKTPYQYYHVQNIQRKI